MRILVTGGSGLIGRAAIPNLIERGHVVRMLSRNATIERGGYTQAIEAVDADVSDPAHLRDAVEGCDVVVHMAGIVDERPPALTFERVNVDGTGHLLDAGAGAGAPTFIHLSSLGADRRASAYHRSKYDAEERVRGYAGRWVILRPGNVFGPGDETISRLLLLARRFAAVPIVGDGRQPFQPIWHRDLGEIIAQAAERSEELSGRVLEIAGPDVTSTEDLLKRFSAITGRPTVRVSVSPWMAGWGAATLDAFGGRGRRWLSRNGLPTPITTSKLELLLQGNVIGPDAVNAIEDFQLTPTTLQEGLAELVRGLPEQLPGTGVGEVSHAAYFADIDGARADAAELLDWVCRHLGDLMPVVVAASPGVDVAEPGRILDLRMPGGRSVQVRVIERTANAVTFAAVEGHPMAGFVRFVSEAASPGVRFTVHVVAQPANVVERMALWPVGRFLQDAGWRNLVRHVVTLSGGRARNGIRRRVYPPMHDDTAALRATVAGFTAGANPAAAGPGGEPAAVDC